MELPKLSSQTISFDVFKLIQPDLLSVEELTNVLRERGVGPSLLSQSKDKLVGLFKRVALPLPQRELSNNYRGSLLSKLRKKAERLKISDSVSNNIKTYTIGITGSASNKFSHEQKYSGDRLKPPPDVSNYERKKVQINSSSSNKSRFNYSSDLDKIVIKKRKTSEDSKISISELNNVKNNKISECRESKTYELSDLHKNLTENIEPSVSSKKDLNGTKNNTVPKKISLKRNHLISVKSSSSSEDNSDKSVLEPDKKRRPITWP